METKQTREPWNKGKLVGQKPRLKLKDIWAIRIHLQNAHSVRDLALFNIAIGEVHIGVTRKSPADAAVVDNVRPSFQSWCMHESIR